MLRPLLILMSFPSVFYITSFLHHTNHLYGLICSVYCSTEIFVHVRAHPHKWGCKCPHPNHKTLSREGIFDVLFMILGLLLLEHRLGSGGSVIWKTSMSCQLFIFSKSVDLCALVLFQMNEGSKSGACTLVFCFLFLSPNHFSYRKAWEHEYTESVVLLTIKTKKTFEKCLQGEGSLIR